MKEVEDRHFVEHRLSVILATTMRTHASGTLKMLGTGGPMERNAALQSLSDMLAQAISRHFEVGQVDTNSRLYVTNYVEPRDPFTRLPTQNR